MRGRRLLVVSLLALSGALGPSVGVAAAAPQCSESTTAQEFPAGSAQRFSLPGCSSQYGGIRFAITRQPAKATVTGPLDSSRDFMMNPKVGASGDDSFQYTATDASGSTTMTRRIRFVGAARACEPLNGATRPGVEKAFQPTCTPPDGADWVEYQMTSQPQNGTAQMLSWSGQVWYKPAPGFTGTDTFRFRVVSNLGASPEAVATIEVTEGANEPPTCMHAGTIYTRMGRTVERYVHCFDADYDPVTMSVADPEHGTATMQHGYLTYTPDPLFEGSDVVQVTADDGRVTAQAPPLTVEVRPPSANDAPFCGDMGAGATGDTVNAFALSCFDPEGDPLRYAVHEQPANGTAVVTDSYPGFPEYVEYTPNKGFRGEDSFLFTANDGRLTSAPGRVGIYVHEPPIGPPECQVSTDPLSIRKNHSKIVDLACASQDESEIEIRLVDAPQHGELVIPPGDGPPVFMPKRGYEGPDRFTFTATNGHGTSQVYEQRVIVDNRAR